MYIEGLTSCPHRANIGMNHGYYPYYLLILLLLCPTTAVNGGVYCYIQGEVYAMAMAYESHPSHNPVP